jgi:hypothetical protein
LKPLAPVAARAARTFCSNSSLEHVFSVRAH